MFFSNGTPEHCPDISDPIMTLGCTLDGQDKMADKQTAEGRSTQAPELVVVTEKSSPVAKVLSRSIAEADSALVLVFFPDVAVALVERPDQTILVPVTAPITDIASALDAGALPSQAFDRWMAATETLLTNIDAAGTRVVMVEASGILCGDAECQAIIATQFSLPELLADVSVETAPFSQIAQAVATNILTGHPDARQLAQTLETKLQSAGTVPPPDFEILDSNWAEWVDRPFDSSLFSAEVRNESLMRQMEDAATDRLESAAENELLRESLSQTLSATQELEEETETLKREIADQRKTLADYHIQTALNDLLQNQVAAKQREHSLREAILGTALLEDARHARTQARTEEDLRRALWEAQQGATAQQEEAQQGTAALQEEIDRIHASKSWKITAPIRAGRRSLKKDR